MELRVGLHLAQSNSRRLGSISKISKTQKNYELVQTHANVEVTVECVTGAMLPGWKSLLAPAGSQGSL